MAADNYWKMKLIAIIILITLTTSFSFGQQCAECKKKFDRLIAIEQQDDISDLQLNESLKIAKELYEKRYVDYIDSISKRTIYVSKNLTHTFASITRKRCDSIGVSAYLNYLSFTSGSVEEERSFGLEQLFQKCPETVIKQIGQSYIEQLAWGFVNNRYYGPVDPFEDDGFKAMTVYKKAEPKLNAENCREIFNMTYPTLVETNKYTEFIELLLMEIYEILKDE